MLFVGAWASSFIWFMVREHQQEGHPCFLV